MCKIVDTNGDGEFQLEEVKEAIMKCVRAGQDGKDREEASQLIFAVMKIVRTKQPFRSFFYVLTFIFYWFTSFEIRFSFKMSQ